MYNGLYAIGVYATRCSLYAYLTCSNSVTSINYCVAMAITYPSVMFFYWVSLLNYQTQQLIFHIQQHQICRSKQHVTMMGHTHRARVHWHMQVKLNYLWH